MTLPGNSLSVSRGYAVTLLSFTEMRHVGEWMQRAGNRARGFQWSSVVIPPRSKRIPLADSIYCWTVNPPYDYA